MKRYSPSTTETWLTCPMKRRLRADGWRSRRLGRKELSGALGTAFAAGMAAYNTGRAAGLPTDPGLCAAIAVQSIRQEIQRAKDGGASTANEADAALLASLEKRAETSIRKYIAADPIPPGWVVLDVERILPEWGNCRIDLGLDTPQGLVVLDYKHKITTDARYLAKDIDRWRLSEQRFHYSNAYGDFIGRPVYAFYICLVVAEPFKVQLIPFVNQPAELSRWREKREGTTWARMAAEDAGEADVDMAATHHDAYGACEWVKACFECQLEPGLMAGEYRREAA